MGFLFSRRWLLFAVVVVAAAWGASQLGQWQFHRLDERREDNRIVARNLAAAPVPVEDVLEVGDNPARTDEWRRVTVHGTWDDEHTVILKYQTRKGASGIDVVTPLITPEGPAVLVDRGWLATRNSGDERPKTPATTDGPVTVTGWVRRNATGGATRVDDLQTRAVSSASLSKVLPYDLYGGFIDLEKVSPAPSTSLEPHELPDDTSEGPHFFYGLQWWFFGALAIAGFGYLAWDERKRLRPVGPSSERAQHAAVDREHDAGDEG